MTKKKLSKKQEKRKKALEQEEENVEAEQQPQQEQQTAVAVEQQPPQQQQETTSEPSASTTGTKQTRVVTGIIYCPICTFPIEYCEFTDQWPQCEKYLAEHYPDVRDELVELRENDKNKNKKISKRKNKEDEKKESPVTIKVSQRNKRKNVTIITGIENYGVNHKDAAKFFAKKFSSGASVVKKPEVAIEIQGDFKEDLLILLPEQFKIPAHVLKIVIEKKKKASEEADEGGEE